MKKEDSNLLTVLAITTVFSICFVLLFTLLLLNCDTYNKYTYIDINNHLGHSNICKKNYCDINGKKIYVKDYIDNRK